VTQLDALVRLKVDGRFVTFEEARQLQIDLPHCHVDRVVARNPDRTPAVEKLKRERLRL
jgi:hypothetical protein